MSFFHFDSSNGCDTWDHNTSSIMTVLTLFWCGGENYLCSFYLSNKCLKYIYIYIVCVFLNPDKMHNWPAPHGQILQLQVWQDLLDSDPPDRRLEPDPSISEWSWGWERVVILFLFFRFVFTNNCLLSLFWWLIVGFVTYFNLHLQQPLTSTFLEVAPPASLWSWKWK